MTFQPLHLEDFDPYYEYLVGELEPGNEEVYFKTLDGKTYKGEYWTETKHFEGREHAKAELKDFDAKEVHSWHPVTVEL